MKDIDQRVIDTILGHSKKEFSFSEIHERLFERGLVSERDRSKTNRALKKLIKEGLIKKHSRGKYELLIDEDEFRLFDYLNSLRQKVHFERLDVGGFLWTLANIYLFGFPKTDILKPFYHVLMARIAWIFYAFEKQAEVEGNGICPELKKEVLLEILPYYLGSKAGIDGDGLPTEDLENLILKLVEAMPEKIEEDGCPQNTMKDIIQKHLSVLRELKPTEKIEEEVVREFFYPKEKSIAMVITPPDFLISEKDYELRNIIGLLKSEGNTKDPLYLAWSVLVNQHNVESKTVEAIIKRFVRDPKVLEEYHYLRRSRELADLVVQIHDLEKAPESRTPSGRALISRLKARFSSLAKAPDLKTLIKYFPVASKRPEFFYWFEQTKADEFLFKLLETEPIDNIKVLLSEGKDLLDRVRDHLFNNMGTILEERKHGG